MFQKIFTLVIISLLFFSCNKTYENALKSNDPDKMLAAANTLFEQEKWQYAIELYGKVASNFAGMDEAEQIAYNSAYANFQDKNYPLAGRQYKNFHSGFSRSDKAEEALFMSAFSYYQGSPDYNLDQKNTREAITELQNFIDTYPNSEKIVEANQYINELQEKLAQKDFEIARSYHKTLKYKSAATSFANFLDDFPDSKYREEAFIYQLRSKSELALQSTFAKKKLRLQEALTTHRLFTRAYPNSKFSQEANNLRDKLIRETEQHEVALANYEVAKKEAEEKAKKEVN
ncbi:MAG: outer membrane protein assembly factor BamD [Weeksellaceae bacterium]|nr:outer membrane protein assembly factor BamD [Weeksellaceae bacterium]